MQNQCVAVARRLGLDPVIKQIRLRTPWRQLSPWILRVGNRWALSSAGDRFDAPYPDLLIATGRQSVAASRAIAELTGNHCLRVQIQDPGIAPRHFDLVVVPRHDQLTGANVLVTRGAPHGVTKTALAEAYRHFAARLGGLPGPRIALLLGGDNGVYRFTARGAGRIAEQIANSIRVLGGSLMLTPSRRTGAAIEAIFREKLAGLPGEIWDGDGENPYLGYLAYADHVLVTADSVNMACEAASTGKPVQIIPLDGGSEKFQRFHDSLHQSGITRPFDGQLEQWEYDPFDDCSLVADRLSGMLRARGWTTRPA